jgi:hypothetical protein
MRLPCKLLEMGASQAIGERSKFGHRLGRQCAGKDCPGFPPSMWRARVVGRGRCALAETVSRFPTSSVLTTGCTNLPSFGGACVCGQSGCSPLQRQSPSHCTAALAPCHRGSESMAAESTQARCVRWEYPAGQPAGFVYGFGAFALANTIWRASMTFTQRIIPVMLRRENYKKSTAESSLLVGRGERACATDLQKLVGRQAGGRTIVMSSGWPGKGGGGRNKKGEEKRRGSVAAPTVQSA